MGYTVPHSKVRTLTQAAQLQRIAYDEALALHGFPVESLTESLARAKALQSLGALWDTARDAVRIAKGKPLPGSLRPKAKERKRNPNRTGQSNGHAEPQGPAIPEPLAKPIDQPAQDNPSA